MQWTFWNSGYRIKFVCYLFSAAHFGDVKLSIFRAFRAFPSIPLPPKTQCYRPAIFADRGLCTFRRGKNEISFFFLNIIILSALHLLLLSHTPNTHAHADNQYTHTHTHTFTQVQRTKLKKQTKQTLLKLNQINIACLKI